MQKKRRKKRRNKSFFGTCLVVFLVIVFLLCVLALAGLKFTEKISDEIDLKTYPLKYTDIIDKYSEEYDVPKSVILAMIKVESNFREDAVSGAGACGLMQLMPDTFTWLASTLGETVTEDEIFLPDINIKYGTYYVSYLYGQLGDWDNVYAAYNAGLTNVRNWLADDRYSSDGELIDIPFWETKNHIVKVNKARDKYNELYFLGE